MGIDPDRKKIKVRILKDFAWYKIGQIVETTNDSQFAFLERLGFIRRVD